MIYPDFDLDPVVELEQFHEYLLKILKPVSKNETKKLLLFSWLEEKLVQKGFPKNRVKLARDLFRGKSSNPLAKGKLENSVNYGGVYSNKEESYRKDPRDPPVTSGNLFAFRAKVSATYIESQDPDLFDIINGVATTHDFQDGKPVWAMAVGPASGGKTSHIEILRKHPLYHDMGVPSSKTFLSGMDSEDTNGREPSLLMRKPNHIYTSDDLTPLLSTHPNERAEVFGQLTKIFDGHYNRSVGNGKELNWDGHITMMVGVTPMIYRHYGTLGRVGPRFLMVRPIQPNREDQSMWNLDARNENEKIQELVDMSADYYIHLPYFEPILPPELVPWYGALGNLVSKARTPVEKGKDSDVDLVYEAEMPNRIAKQLVKMSKGISRFNLRIQLGGDEQRMSRRVGFNTIPPVRSFILQRLLENKELSAADVHKSSFFASHIAYSTLSEMKYLDLVDSDGLEYGEKWRLTKWARSLMELIDQTGPKVTLLYDAYGAPAIPTS